MSFTGDRTKSKHVLLVGDFVDPELQAVVRWLDGVSELVCRNTPSQALADANAASSLSTPAPDVIVVAQTRPGQWSESDIENLHQVWPLARIVALLGSWCEGETRTGRPWPGVPRVYWYEFMLRMSPLLLPKQIDGQNSWTLPRTASFTERLACDVARIDPAHNKLSRRKIRGPDPMNHSTGNLRPSVAIVADSWDAYESIADACAAADFLAEWVRPPAMNPCIPDGQSLADAGIWDVRWGDEQEWGEIAEFVRHLSPAPVIAIQGFPRWQDAQRAARIGVAALLAKPFNIPDLWRALAGDDVVSARLALPADPAHPANHSTTVSPPDYNLQEGTVHRASLPNPSRKV